MDSKEKPVRRRKLADGVVERLSLQIRSGELKAGERLPTERAMAGHMGVSRTVIREAVHILVDKGVLELKNGCGYVRQLSFEEIMSNISDIVAPGEISVLEIMEVRRLLENYIARKAAENITSSSVKRLQGTIDAMAEVLEEQDRGFEEERAFHRGLAEATGNGALKSIYVLCEDLLNRAQQGGWQAARAIGVYHRTLEEHQAILDAVREHDGERAEKLMQEHIDYSCRNVQKLCERADSQFNREAGEGEFFRSRRA